VHTLQARRQHHRLAKNFQTCSADLL
jgi:hypothetical protein